MKQTVRCNVVYSCLILALVGSVFAQEQRRERPPLPKPDFENVKYGPHERNVFDLWLAKSDKPTPLVIYIHGGGFSGGDKKTISARNLENYLKEGWSVAALHYRLTRTAPAPAAYLDCGRATQYLRHNAEKWNLNKNLFASTGGSAGAGTSLWLAFHDDLADPDSKDSVSRESTRLTCVSVSSAQCSYDPRFVEKFGIPRPNLELHGFFFPFYGIERSELDSEKAYNLYEEMAAITHLSKDDPPAMLSYGLPNRDADPKEELNLVVHHPRFGIELKKKMDGLGIECVVQYREGDRGPMIQHGGGDLIQSMAFIRKHFELAGKGK